MRPCDTHRSRRRIRPRALAISAGLALTVGLGACTADGEPTQPTDPEATAVEEQPADPEATVAEEQPTDPWVESPSPTSTYPEPGSEQLRSEAPAVDGWEDVEGLEAPVSAEHGPQQQDGALWTGYEHSAEGAVLAAHYVFAAQGNVPGYAEAWGPEGELRDAVLEDEQQGPVPVDTMIIVGFRNVDFTPDTAVVDIAAHVTGTDRPGLMYTRIMLRWDGEKWQVDTEAPTQWNPQQNGSLDDFVDWGRLTG